MASVLDVDRTYLNGKETDVLGDLSGNVVALSMKKALSDGLSTGFTRCSGRPLTSQLTLSWSPWIFPCGR
ncbi:MAG: hypothetical protein QMA93_05565 [Acidimicrobiales bacterium]|jgi:hypothetical protein